MIRWTDAAVVLSARAHGEGSAIVQLLTREHGRHAGLLRGASTARRRGGLEPGSEVEATWQARLADHLGTLTIEPVRTHAALWLDDPARLAGLGAACAVAEAVLFEREPHPATFEGLLALLDGLGGPMWAAAYVGWELGLLADLGYGLDLSRCAVSGATSGLAFVSPRTGRAVAAAAAGSWADRLLPLPGFLVGGGGPDDAAIRAGLDLTGYFLLHHVLEPAGRALPGARQRLLDCFPPEPAAPAADVPP